MRRVTSVLLIGLTFGIFSFFVPVTSAESGKPPIAEIIHRIRAVLRSGWTMKVHGGVSPYGFEPRNNWGLEILLYSSVYKPPKGGGKNTGHTCPMLTIVLMPADYNGRPYKSESPDDPGPQMSLASFRGQCHGLKIYFRYFSYDISWPTAEKDLLNAICGAREVPTKSKTTIKK
jgi:hypothetical protein